MQRFGKNMIGSSDLKSGDERLREIVTAIGKSDPICSRGTYEKYCSYCGSSETYNESHKENCIWLLSNKVIQEIESGYFDAPKCHRYGVIYAEHEENDEYFYCRNIALNNGYCEEHQNYYKSLRGK